MFYRPGVPEDMEYLRGEAMEAMSIPKMNSRKLASDSSPRIEKPNAAANSAPERPSWKPHRAIPDTALP